MPLKEYAAKKCNGGGSKLECGPEQQHDLMIHFPKWLERGFENYPSSAISQFVYDAVRSSVSS